MNEKLQSIILMCLLFISIYFTLHPYEWMLTVIPNIILFSVFVIAMIGAVVKGKSYSNAPEFMIIFLMIFLGWIIMAVPSIEYTGFFINEKTHATSFNIKMYRNLLLSDISIFTYTLTYLLK